MACCSKLPTRASSSSSFLCQKVIGQLYKVQNQSSLLSAMNSQKQVACTCMHTRPMKILFGSNSRKGNEGHGFHDFLQCMKQLSNTCSTKASAAQMRPRAFQCKQLNDPISRQHFLSLLCLICKRGQAILQQAICPPCKPHVPLNIMFPLTWGFNTLRKAFLFVSQSRVNVE